MKTSKIDEDKKLNFFIIAIVLIIVISISAIVYGVQKQKNNNEEETEIQTTSTVLQDETQAISTKNENSDDNTSVSDASNNNTNAANPSGSTKNSSSAGISIEAENKRYKEECSRINKKYDDIIAANEATKRLLLQEYYEKEKELQNKQAELDILKATGAIISESDQRYQEIRSLQAQTDDLQKGINDADQKISNAKSNKTDDLAEAEKKHKANLNK